MWNAQNPAKATQAPARFVSPPSPGVGTTAGWNVPLKPRQAGIPAVNYAGPSGLSPVVNPVHAMPISPVNGGNQPAKPTFPTGGSPPRGPIVAVHMSAPRGPSPNYNGPTGAIISAPGSSGSTLQTVALWATIIGGAAALFYIFVKK